MPRFENIFRVCACSANSLLDKRAWRLAVASTLLVAALLSTLVGCTRRVGAPPKDSQLLDVTPKLYPDYVDVTIPVNIAPLNFDVCEEGEEIATYIWRSDASEVADKPLFSFSGSEVRFPISRWKNVLRENVGRTLRVSVYVTREGKRLRFKDTTIFVSPDKIDPYVSYRLVGPGYERFSDLSLWTRNIENFKEQAIFHARLVNERTCVNCHTFQDRRTENFFFHTRLVQGGTIFVEDGSSVTKRDLTAEGLNGGCSYAAWRPNSKHVAFTVNQTRQLFHLKSLDRIDVLDTFSDLYLYDVTRNTLTPITPPGDDQLAIFPNWSQDGEYLYYSSAKNPGFTTTRNDVEERRMETSELRTKFKYDIMRVSFDEKTGRFGTPELVFDASGQDKSALFPRLSPDGKTLLFTLTDYGCFPIWYRDSNIWSLNLETGEARAVDEINSPEEPDSYHSWDSSGRWIVFSSRRDDGSYTRLYFSHFNDDQTFSRPVMLPQKAPVKTLETLRSYNIPEFTIEPVRVSGRRLLKEAQSDSSVRARLAR